MIKAIHILSGLLLLYIAWLQVNDPDPLFWVSLYVCAAMVPLLALIKLKPASRIFISGLACGFCLAGITMVFDGALEYLQHLGSESLIQDMSPKKPYIEEAREIIGAAIALGICLSYWVFNNKHA